mgnify:CR=1 FL=1
MKIRIEDIIKARNEIVHYHQQKQEQRVIKILPMQENFNVPLSSDPSEPHYMDYPLQLATVKFEDYGELIVEVPDPPELQALKEQLINQAAKIAQLEH